MFQPISFNVIRQCLDKMGLPACMLRVLSAYKLPDGTQTAEYRLGFPSVDVANWLTNQGLADYTHGIELFQSSVAQSFAADITILDAIDFTQPGVIALIAHVRVPPHAEQMEMFS